MRCCACCRCCLRCVGKRRWYGVLLWCGVVGCFVVVLSGKKNKERCGESR